MRNLRKLAAVVIAVALVLTSMTAAFAASGSYEFEDQATVLKDLDIWQGNAAGDLMLGEKLTRAQGAVLVLKTVLGKTDKDMEAADVSKIATFDDAAEVPAWAEGWVALAVDAGVMKGGNNKLAAGDALKGKDLASMFMNALGFAAENNYATAVELLAAKSAGKILSAIVDDITDAELTRDAATAVVFDTLTVKAKDATKTVVEVLVGTDATKKAVAEKAGLIVAPAAQAVTGVKALNLVQVQITFAKDLVKADAEKKENYVVTQEGATSDLVGGSGKPVLQADGKTVLLTLTTAVDNGKNAIVEVKNIATYKSDAITFKDETVPSVVGVTVSGPKTLTVEYSEPVQFVGPSTSTLEQIKADAILNEFKVDGGNYIVTGIEIDKFTNKAVVTVGVNFTEGEHKVSFESKAIGDFAGYKVLPRTVSFTVTNDKTAPVLTLKSADPRQVVLTSNKPLVDTTVKQTNVRFSHTYNSGNYAVLGDAVTLNPTNTEITITFGDSSVIPLGANNLFVSYVDENSQQITDLWGNKLPAAIIPMNITLDTVKPTVTEVKFIDATHLQVVFSEKVDSAVDSTAKVTGNYVIKDSTGKAITVVSAAIGSGDDVNKVNLETGILNGGSYTIEIKGVKDDAFVKNVMEAYSNTLNFTDKVNPTVDKASVRMAISADGKKASIYIPFSEQMDPTTLVKANFMKSIDGAAYAALDANNDTVTAAADGKSVTIVLDKGSFTYNAFTGETVTDDNVSVMVGIVKDIAGNSLMTYTDTVTPKRDTIGVAKVEAIAKNQIKVTFDGRTEGSVPAAGFTLKSTAKTVTLSTQSVSVNSDGKTEVLMNFNDALNENGQYEDATVLEVAAGSTVKSYLGAAITTGVTVPVEDKIVPTVDSVKVATDGTIAVTFFENIDTSTLATKTLNGFSVSGDIKIKSVSAAGKVITLTPEDGKKFADSTVVKYNSVAGITDTSSNKVADFEKTSTK